MSTLADKPEKVWSSPLAFLRDRGGWYPAETIAKATQRTADKVAAQLNVMVVGGRIESRLYKGERQWRVVA